MRRSLAAKIESANQALMANEDFDAIEKYFAPNYLAHLTGKDMTGGHAAIRRTIKMYYKAFTQRKVNVDILVKYKDRIAWQRTIKAKHTGPFKGFPATNRSIVWRDMITSRFEDGLIAEEWFITDLAERLLLARKK